jgi:hypothetical protein
LKKRTPAPAPSLIKKTVPKNEKMFFSFELFDAQDSDVCPAIFPDVYTKKLMSRLAAVSQMTEAEFRQPGKSLRSHELDWKKTSKPDGFSHLNQQQRDLMPWQFSVSANEHGRVHGIIIDNLFYVVWLDVNHCLYP